MLIRSLGGSETLSVHSLNHALGWNDVTPWRLGDYCMCSRDFLNVYLRQLITSKVCNICVRSEWWARLSHHSPSHFSAQFHLCPYYIVSLGCALTDKSQPSWRWLDTRLSQCAQLTEFTGLPLWGDMDMGMFGQEDNLAK